jgi:predicted alpha/beta hydrolase
MKRLIGLVVLAVVSFLVGVTVSSVGTNSEPELIQPTEFQKDIIEVQHYMRREAASRHRLRTEILKKVNRVPVSVQDIFDEQWERQAAVDSLLECVFYKKY